MGRLRPPADRAAPARRAGRLRHRHGARYCKLLLRCCSGQRGGANSVIVGTYARARWERERELRASLERGPRLLTGTESVQCAMCRAHLL